MTALEQLVEILCTETGQTTVDGAIAELRAWRAERDAAAARRSPLVPILAAEEDPISASIRRSVRASGTWAGLRGRGGNSGGRI